MVRHLIIRSPHKVYNFADLNFIIFIVSSKDANDSQPIESTLAEIRGEMLKNFTTKWSKHRHTKVDGADDEKCSAALVMDGLWKINRAKCCYDEVYVATDMGDLQTGCIATPGFNSYYCDQHKNEQLIFNLETEKIAVKPKDIKLSRIRSNPGILLLLFKIVVTIICYL